MAVTNANPQRVPGRLADADRDAVLALVHAVAEADGTSALSEDGRLAVAHGRPGVLHVLWRETCPSGADTVVGYLYLSPADEARDRTAELCVAPEFRGHGIGRALVDIALGETSGTLRIWAHGTREGAWRLAESLGFAAIRDLRLLELPVVGDSAHAFPVPPLPDGVELTAFRPGRDEAAWLALNARAFAHHPEQGAWTERDLAEREAEPWFDPAGFFLARAAGTGADGGAAEGELLGFHWTKVHPAGAYGPGPVGEIYVLGVDPSQHGRGLGRLLALVGLRHLAQSGLHTIVLYVDGDNAPAVRLYKSLGFRTRSADTLYERRGSG